MSGDGPRASELNRSQARRISLPPEAPGPGMAVTTDASGTGSRRLPGGADGLASLEAGLEGPVSVAICEYRPTLFLVRSPRRSTARMMARKGDRTSSVCPLPPSATMHDAVSQKSRQNATVRYLAVGVTP